MQNKWNEGLQLLGKAKEARHNVSSKTKRNKIIFLWKIKNGVNPNSVNIIFKENKKTEFRKGCFGIFTQDERKIVNNPLRKFFDKHCQAMEHFTWGANLCKVLDRYRC